MENRDIYDLWSDGDKCYGKKKKKLRQEERLESGWDHVRREVRAGLCSRRRRAHSYVTAPCQQAEANAAKAADLRCPLLPTKELREEDDSVEPSEQLLLLSCTGPRPPCSLPGHGRGFPRTFP